MLVARPDRAGRFSALPIFPVYGADEGVCRGELKRRLGSCSMYAIIRSGGKQYRAEVGATIDVDRLPQTVGDSIEISDVLLVANGDETHIGRPRVEGATVTATVVEQFRGKKIIVYKYRQRTNYRRKQGHRQYYTRLRIEDIKV